MKVYAIYDTKTGQVVKSTNTLLIYTDRIYANNVKKSLNKKQNLVDKSLCRYILEVLEIPDLLT